MSKREAIIQFHCAGRTNSDIIKLYHVVKKINELGTSEDCPRIRRPCTARSKKMIKAVQERLRRNPKRSAREVAKDMNVSVTSMRRIIKMTSSCFPYEKKTIPTPV